MREPPFAIDQRVLVTDEALELRDEPAVVKSVDAARGWVTCDIPADTSGLLWTFTYAQTRSVVSSTPREASE